MTYRNLSPVSKKTGDSSAFQFGRRTQTCKPTGFHQHGRGRLVDDGAYFGEGGEAAVVRPAVVLQGVREVQVAVDARGNPLVLLDVLESWRKKTQGHAVNGENRESLSFGENLKAKTQKFTFEMVLRKLRQDAAAAT